MNRVVRTDYEVVNARGVVLFTSSEPEIARREALKLGAQDPSVKVESVTLTETRTRFFRPLHKPAVNFAIPPCPVVRMGVRA